MKKEFDKRPDLIKENELYGFSWLEYVLAVPSPLAVVTSYKSNGKPNASMQSWCTFTGAGGNYYCIFSSVNKASHTYSSIKETGCCVVNFPSEDILEKCMDTIKYNEFENDEIAVSGLTAEPSRVNAPRIRECFLNIDCVLDWERDLTDGGDYAVMCFKAVGISMDEQRYNENDLGRYGESGYLYNIRARRDPETGKKTSSCAGHIRKGRSL